VPLTLFLHNQNIRRFLSRSKGANHNTCYAIADGGFDGGAQDSSAEDLLVVVNKITGAVSNIGFTGTFDVEAIELWPNTETLFAADAGRLVILDLADGSSSPVGTGFGTAQGALGSLAINDVDGLAFDASIIPPILYGSVRRSANGANDLIIQINTNTGTFVQDAFGAGNDYLVVSNFQSTTLLDDIDDIAINPTDGTMYAILNDGGVNDHLVIINLADGSVINDPICGASYVITRTWTATDACGGSSTCEQIITVLDTSAPVLDPAPADITVECDAVPVAATLGATENCDPAPVVTGILPDRVVNCLSGVLLQGHQLRAEQSGGC